MKTAHLIRALDDHMNWSDEQDRLQTALEPILRRGLDFGVAQIEAEVSRQIAPIADEDALRFLQERTPNIQDITIGTAKQINAQLAEGLAQGESYEALAARVRGVYDKFSDERSYVIAFTESQIAINTGRHHAIQESGIELKAWLATSLSNSRPEHQAAQAKYRNGIPVADPFIVGGEELAHPGDPAGSPGNVINCRCTVIALPGSADEVRNIGTLTYKAWSAEKSEVKSQKSAARTRSGNHPRTSAPSAVKNHPSALITPPADKNAS